MGLTQITQFDGPQSPVRSLTDSGMAQGSRQQWTPRPQVCSVSRGGRALGSDQLVPLVIRCLALAKMPPNTPLSMGIGELPAPEGTTVDSELTGGALGTGGLFPTCSALSNLVGPLQDT